MGLAQVRDQPGCLLQHRPQREPLFKLGGGRQRRVQVVRPRYRPESETHFTPGWLHLTVAFTLERTKRRLQGRNGRGTVGYTPGCYQDGKQVGFTLVMNNIFYNYWETVLSVDVIDARSILNDESRRYWLVWPLRETERTHVVEQVPTRRCVGCTNPAPPLVVALLGGARQAHH